MIPRTQDMQGSARFPQSTLVSSQNVTYLLVLKGEGK